MVSLVMHLFPDSGPQITQVQQVKLENIFTISVINSLTTNVPII